MAADVVIFQPVAHLVIDSLGVVDDWFVAVITNTGTLGAAPCLLEIQIDGIDVAPVPIMALDPGESFTAYIADPAQRRISVRLGAQCRTLVREWREEK